jgi:hypothetical protein
MTAVQKVYRELRKYVTREDARYAAPKMLELALSAQGAGDRSTKTPGQIAYEEDVRRKPGYHPRVDGTVRPRRTWDELDRVVQQSWELNPTPRDW